MANNKGKMSASGVTPGGGIKGSISGRKLGYPGEGKPYMSALTKGTAPHCPIHKQDVCANGRGMGNKGAGWKPNQKSGTVPKNVFPAFVKPSNYKRRQDNHR